MKKLFNILMLCALLGLSIAISGCGGGGGGGGSSTPTAPAQSKSTISSSVAAKNFIAKQIAGTYSDLDNYSTSQKYFSLRASNKLRASTITEPGFGHARIVYDTIETVELFGVKYTYHSGYQDLFLRDSAGNPTENEYLADSLEIKSVQMGCRINDGANLMDLTYNGSLIFSGFANNTTKTVSAQELNIAGSINSTDQINWTINGNVSVSSLSYPYPENNSSESGTLIFNNHIYSYTTSYDGSNLASLRFSGAENFLMTINLATGIVVDADCDTQQSDIGNLTGSWKLVEEDREGIMLPVKANAGGKVSLLHFYADTTFKIESIERFSDTTKDYWQTKNV